MKKNNHILKLEYENKSCWETTTTEVFPWKDPILNLQLRQTRWVEYIQLQNKCSDELKQKKDCIL